MAVSQDPEAPLLPPDVFRRAQLLHDIRLHDAAQFVDAFDEKRLEVRISDLLGEAARLVVESVMYRTAGDGSNPFIEVDGGSA